MATEAQIEVNRRNAQMSTGPVTPEGKAIVSQNATKHGIMSRKFVITTGDGRESPEEWKELLTGLVEYWQPKGTMQELLVEKIAINYWRLYRLVRYETGKIRESVDNPVPNALSTPEIRVMANAVPAGQIDNICKYETMLERSIERNVKLLRELHGERTE